jgi:hypothetical protein
MFDSGQLVAPVQNRDMQRSPIAAVLVAAVVTLALGGCGGDFVVELRFRLSRPKGTPHDATATATVTAGRIGDRSAFTGAHPAPRVGESFRIRLRDGVITEPLTGANYCGPGVDWPDAGCGA